MLPPENPMTRWAPRGPAIFPRQGSGWQWGRPTPGCECRAERRQQDPAPGGLPMRSAQGGDRRDRGRGASDRLNPMLMPPC